MFRIGVDIGGTFTDFAVWSDSTGIAGATSFKVPSTPPTFIEGFRSGLEAVLEKFQPAADEPVIVMHGTTISTNAVIERNGSQIALLVTKGYRDVLELQRFKLLKPIDLFAEQTVPLIPRNHVYEIDERLVADGSVRTPIDLDEVVAVARRALADGAKGLAISFIHAYRNPAHERAAADAIRAALGDVPISLSSELWPRIGEYERTIVCVLNAYVKERMGGYLSEVKAYLSERLPNAQLYITRSNGGAMAVEEARNSPVQTLLSGPASGVTAAQFLARSFADTKFLTLDMGGTSTDLSYIQAGQPTVSTDAEVGAFPLSMPVTGIEAIGAGGGSIIRMDAGVLRVGPESAGANPGPACFGRGGTLPTVTDAYLLCGYLNPDNFLGGRMQLDVEAARLAMQPIAAALKTDLVTAAEACLSVATSNMVASALPYLARHGVDPEDVTLVLFGGNGALHGPLLAAEIGVRRVLVPTLPSVFCAFGGVVSDLVHDLARAMHGVQMSAGLMGDTFAALTVEGEQWLRSQVRDDQHVEQVIEYWAEVRYAGQSFQLPVQVDKEQALAGDLAAIAAAFHAEHLRLYTHADESRGVEIIEFRVRVRGQLPAPRSDSNDAAPAADGKSETARRDLWIGGALHKGVTIHDRTRMGGAPLLGPAIIEQNDATILVPPGYRAEVVAAGEIVLTKED